MAMRRAACAARAEPPGTRRFGTSDREPSIIDRPACARRRFRAAPDGGAIVAFAGTGLHPSISVCNDTHIMTIHPRGADAARLRQRKFRRLADLVVPPNALPGSLALTHRRCGQPTCRCATGEGHPLWSLTFMVQGKKRVERIPDDWVADVRRQVKAGR